MNKKYFSLLALITLAPWLLGASSNFGTISVANVPIGTVLEFAGTVLPDGWVWADGACYSRTTYNAGFSVLGTTHGACDGSTLFAVPDRRGKFARGWFPTAQASFTTSGTAASDFVTATGHTMRTATKVKMLSGTISGLTNGNYYWTVVDPLNPNLIGFASSRSSALTKSKIALSGTASGSFVQAEDEDAFSRPGGSNGGLTNTNVGSFQADEFKSHTHNPTGWYNNSVSDQGGLGVFTSNNGQPRTSNNATTASGGTDTRPVNIAMGYIIRIQ